jgi:signal transduction histidine kinase/CheY-like chemotaxis protein
MAEETILIVDDDRTMLVLCQHLLEMAGYRVITAANPLEGLRILERQRADLLLTDIRMPVMDGFELISRAKQYQPDLPVLVMTGYGSIENAIQALHRGVDGLIVKPFENTAEPLQAVRRILEANRQKRDAVRVHALRPLFDLTERLLSETSPHTLEKLIIETVTALLQASFAGIYRFEGGAGRPETGQVLESTPGYPARDAVLDWLRSWDGGPVVAGAGGPLQFQTVLHEAGLETLMVAPVVRTSHLVFCAGRGTGAASYNEADLEMFVILARQAAVAMENARLYSELKDYVNQVEESQRALIQAEKMAAVGRLVASLAHEINNPLQAVRNCLHLAGRKGLDEKQLSQYLEMTDNELDRLVQTVRRMLDFYRPVSAEKEQVDVCTVVEQVLALLDAQMREQGIQVHYSRPGAVRPAMAVPSQLQQVIFNLLINAIDALEESRGADKVGKEIWVDVFDDGRRVTVLVEDSGPGVPEALQEQIFEPFVSTKKNGTGLGLAVSFGILERHQGRLALAPPRYASGACFEVVLPAEGA